MNIPNNLANLINSENHYSILGLNFGASDQDIKKAYRKLSMELHPDRNKSNFQNSDKYKKVTSAYNVLSNKSEKAAYDNMFSGLNGIKLSNLNDGMFMNMTLNPLDLNSLLKDLKTNGFNPKEIFNSFNLSSPLFSQIFKNEFENDNPSSLFESITINLLDAYKGCKIPLLINRYIIENSRKFEQKENIYIDIPEGIDNNEIITLKEKGNKINGKKGDIEVKIIINNYTLFERNGIDLIFRKSITLKDALCGFTFDIKYLDGREFKINNEKGNIIPSNFQKRVSNLGMKRENVIGDLIIIFDVEFPKTLTENQIKELSHIL
tara:strand:+ start:1996 stop:2958 length:963 start_codon:yes stop_codon:yes gene_type:complete